MTSMHRDRRSWGRVEGTTVTLAHGAGGRAMRDLIEGLFLAAFGSPSRQILEDQARADLSEFTAGGDRMAFTTDSFVVDPLFFPGGDIGRLAVCGTINDLAVGGATPLYLSCAFILEEGLDLDVLRRVAASMAVAAVESGVRIVTGDTKVVNRGACDKLFITTSGVGVIPHGIHVGIAKAQPGDVVLVNGFLGDHGAAILEARGEMALQSPIVSDCAPLHDLCRQIIGAAPGVRCLRDATRGGAATVLNEIAEASLVGIQVEERRIPVREEVRGFCEILGLDPVYLANEGKLIVVASPEAAEPVLATMRAHPLGTQAAEIGRITEQEPGRVVIRSVMGGRRILDMMVGDQLPRIC